jgi:DNA-binding IclR family transcriptional regulator
MLPTIPCTLQSEVLRSKAMSQRNEQLDGNTLNVYMYVAKKRKPQGPRDVMRGMKLSSPSVAYRHLQKLEAQGLLARNEYGEYQLKKKVSVNGFHWIGRNLLPRTMFFSIGFLALLLTEVIVLVIHWQWEDYVIKTYYAIGISITALAMAFFLFEALSTLRRLKVKETT